MFINKLLLINNIMSKLFFIKKFFFYLKDLNLQSISLIGIEQDYNQTILYLYKSGENG
jgi:hypothetical protein